MIAGGESSRTFRQRLTASMALLAIVVLALASIAIYVRVRLELQSTLDSALLNIAQVEVASAVDEPGGRVHVHDEIPVPTSPVGSGYEK